MERIFEEESSENEEDVSPAYTNNPSMNGNEAAEYSAESSEEENNIELEDDPFMEIEEYPSLKIVKEKNFYQLQAPSNHIVSPHKPILQADDLSVLETYFDICINSSTKKASGTTRLEYQNYMKDQNHYRSLEKNAWCLL